MAVKQPTKESNQLRDTPPELGESSASAEEAAWKEAEEDIIAAAVKERLLQWAQQEGVSSLGSHPGFQQWGFQPQPENVQGIVPPTAAIPPRQVHFQENVMVEIKDHDAEEDIPAREALRQQ